ncbi:uncharacterized protein LOC131244213 [Magnolia sinica]|uniref:uncharacterized protein LOC131244213 n=1 Tax=Magnolia sinica TaxID=86752 RepID=UPI002658898C|nr:uncharacterized protein LOC131244213 [Magnolia sinica]
MVYFFQGGKIPRAVNSSLICLVPKGAAPRKWADYCPISLCDCLYKIFSMIIAVRLSQILPSLISPKGMPSLRRISALLDEYQNASGQSRILRLNRSRLPSLALHYLGDFSVKSAWDVRRAIAPKKDWARWVWHGNLPPKISLFIWKILYNAIPMEKTVQSRGVSLASKCGCCRDDFDQGPAEESVSHLFLFGQQASSVWEFFGVQAGISIMHASTVEARIRQWRRACADRSGTSVTMLLTLAFILWEMWKSRNGAVYDGKAMTIQPVIAKVSWWLNTTNSADIKRRSMRLHPLH